jgi:hypothetical protein
MLKRWIAPVSGLLLLTGVALLVVAWLPQWPDTSSRWLLMTSCLAPYLLLALAAWSFRRSWRGSMAVLLVSVPVVALGIWASWPDGSSNKDEAIAAILFAALTAMFQLLLSTVAVVWAGLWSFAHEGAGGPSVTLN